MRRPALLDQPLFALITGYLKIAEACLQQQARNLQSEALGCILVIITHRKSKPGQLCDDTVAMLESDAAGRLPLTDASNQRFANRLAAAVKVEPAILFFIGPSQIWMKSFINRNRALSVETDFVYMVFTRMYSPPKTQTGVPN